MKLIEAQFVQNENENQKKRSQAYRESKDIDKTESFVPKQVS